MNSINTTEFYNSSFAVLGASWSVAGFCWANSGHILAYTAALDIMEFDLLPQTLIF